MTVAVQDAFIDLANNNILNDAITTFKTKKAEEKQKAIVYHLCLIVFLGFLISLAFLKKTIELNPGEILSPTNPMIVDKDSIVGVLVNKQSSSIDPSLFPIDWSFFHIIHYQEPASYLLPLFKQIKNLLD
jgi:hypothetical protein